MNNINLIKEIRKIRAKIRAEQLIAEQRAKQELAIKVVEFCAGKSQAFKYSCKLLDNLIEKLEKQSMNI